MSNVKAARMTTQMSQTELAERCGISRSTMCDIENDRSKPSFNVACKIAAAIYGDGYTVDNLKYLME